MSKNTQENKMKLTLLWVDMQCLQTCFLLWYIYIKKQKKKRKQKKQSFTIETDEAAIEQKAQ